MRTKRPFFPLSWLLLSALLGAGCRSTGPLGGAPKPGPEDEEEGSELQELSAKYELARLELELARLEAQQAVTGAERKLVEARIGQEKAGLEREAFDALGRARELDESRLGIDQARGRAEDAAAELAELEAMYAAEEFATKTKELVLTRGRRQLELAKRALDLAERQDKELSGFELPAKERELELARVGAEKELKEAEEGLTKVRLEQKIAIAKAEQEVAELERKLRKTKAGKSPAAKQKEPKP
jgi:hypothetical protein